MFLSESMAGPSMYIFFIHEPTQYDYLSRRFPLFATTYNDVVVHISETPTYFVSRTNRDDIGGFSFTCLQVLARQNDIKFHYNRQQIGQMGSIKKVNIFLGKELH